MGDPQGLEGEVEDPDPLLVAGEDRGVDPLLVEDGLVVEAVDEPPGVLADRVGLEHRPEHDLGDRLGGREVFLGGGRRRGILAQGARTGDPEQHEGGRQHQATRWIETHEPFSPANGSEGMGFGPAASRELRKGKLSGDR